MDLDGGINAQGAVRRMANGKGHYLHYDAYMDEARTRRWGNTDAERYNAGIPQSHHPREFIMYGRIPGSQDVPEDVYHDALLMTVHF
jgi:spore coat protein U-like protein